MQKCKGERARASNSSFISSQSAMEYLMTYGWAILIIAIVLVALFSLGVFNRANFSPRAQPGSCEVLRNSVQTSLGGQCNGMLPEYVAELNGSNYIISSGSQLPSGSSPRTMSGWIFEQQQTGECSFGYGGNPSSTYGSFALCENWNAPGQLHVDNCGQGFFADGGAPVLNQNTWYFIATNWTGPPSNVLSIFIDGKLKSSYINPITISTIAGSFLTSGRLCDTPSSFFTGLMANIQIYNTSLSAPEIQALYQEGIGGAPIDLQNLVGWWPLNGNANA